MAIKKKVDFLDKKSRLSEILKRDYDLYTYLITLLSLVLMLFASLSLNGTLSLDTTHPTLMSWFLFSSGLVMFILSVIPFFKSAYPEIKQITWLNKRQFFTNILRVVIFISILLAISFLFASFISSMLWFSTL